jgi:hypothetical protein
VPSETDYALYHVQKALNWSNHFQREQKSIQEDNSEKERFKLFLLNCWSNMDNHSDSFHKNLEIMTSRAFPLLYVLEYIL